VSELADAADASAAEMRRQYHYSFGNDPGEWYVHLPYWLVHHNGKTLEQFEAEFEQSCKRMAGLPLGNMVGFEVVLGNGEIYRHRLSWLDGGSALGDAEEGVDGQ
jgi:hypothetical protein